jgi:hypothetical protein
MLRNQINPFFIFVFLGALGVLVVQTTFVFYFGIVHLANPLNLKESSPFEKGGRGVLAVDPAETNSPSIPLFQRGKLFLPIKVVVGL